MIGSCDDARVLHAIQTLKGRMPEEFGVLNAYLVRKAHDQLLGLAAASDETRLRQLQGAYGALDTLISDISNSQATLHTLLTK